MHPGGEMRIPQPYIHSDLNTPQIATPDSDR